MAYIRAQLGVQISRNKSPTSRGHVQKSRPSVRPLVIREIAVNSDQALRMRPWLAIRRLQFKRKVWRTEFHGKQQPELLSTLMFQTTESQVYLKRVWSLSRRLYDLPNTQLVFDRVLWAFTSRFKSNDNLHVETVTRCSLNITASRRKPSFFH